MSHDQKPSRIKLVSSGGAARAPDSANAVAAAGGSGADAAVGEAESGTKSAGRGRVVPAIMFLAGCALGGAGLAAWPHLAS